MGQSVAPDVGEGQDVEVEYGVGGDKANSCQMGSHVID